MQLDSEVAIIGAGPIALELAVALKQVKISYLQFEKGQLGQMIYNFSPHTRFFSSSERIEIAGIPIQTIDQQKCSREEYLAYLRAVVMQHRLVVNAYEEVLSIEKEQNSFRITTRTSVGERQYRVNFVVIATGGTSRPRRLNIPGEDLPHVSIKMGDPHRYFQQKLLIIGSKNSAAEAALRCYHAGVHVTMAVRREAFEPEGIKYWIMPELQGCIDRKEINCLFGVEAIEIFSDHVAMRKRSDGKIVNIAADFVMKAIGFDADMSLFKQLGIPLITEHLHPVFDEKTMETPISNVFVLGTVTGGTQKRYRIFIENCHVHVEKILDELCKRLNVRTHVRSISGVNSFQYTVNHLEE